jgi:hypothetical protein
MLRLEFDLSCGSFIDVWCKEKVSALEQFNFKPKSDRLFEAAVAMLERNALRSICQAHQPDPSAKAMYATDQAKACIRRVNSGSNRQGYVNNPRSEPALDRA